MHKLTVRTRSRTEMQDVTAEVQRVVAESGVREGFCLVFVPHTTAGVTINENADPSVRADMLKELNAVVPFEDGYAHAEGNSAAHIKASLMGSSATVIVEGARLALGTWQGIYFCEFDGPRTRQIWVACR
jgi:secondary thiamine-phosphate synthase enzyme